MRFPSFLSPFPLLVLISFLSLLPLVLQVGPQSDRREANVGPNFEAKQQPRCSFDGKEGQEARHQEEDGRQGQEDEQLEQRQDQEQGQARVRGGREQEEKVERRCGGRNGRVTIGSRSILLFALQDSVRGKRE